MPDGTTLTAGALGGTHLPSRRASGARRFLGKRSTISFFLALPLILLIGGLVIWPAFYAIDLAMLTVANRQFRALAAR